MSTRYSVVLVLALPSLVLADVYSYECDSFPLQEGWILEQAWCDCPPQPCEGNLWIKGGQLFNQNGVCEEVVGANFATYQRAIGDNFSTSEAWFSEWKVVTNGISDEFPWVAPAHVVVWDGNGVVRYHFTIADDRVRIIRNETVYSDLAPGVPHTFRIELFGQDLGEFFAIYIDGVVVESGVPIGPLFDPPWEAGFTFRSKAILVPHITIWDYFRWGDIPTDGSGDFNSDGEIDSTDFYFFQECLETEAGSWPGCAWADMDQDGDTDCDDAEAFAAAWTGEGDPPTFATCNCPSDLNDSGTVDAADLALLLGAWGPGSFADLNGDDLVNASDLAELLGAWGACQ